MKKELIVEEVKAGDNTEISFVKNIFQDKIKLIKNSKGYGWEITVFFDTIVEGISHLEMLDRQMKKQWGSMEGIEKED